MAYIQWIICSEPFVTVTYLYFWYIQNLSMLKTQDIRYRESLKYSLHRTLCNLHIFIVYIYSNPSILRTRGIWWTVFYGTLCNTGIFRNILGFKVLNKIFYNRCLTVLWICLGFWMFRTLAYSESKAYSQYCQTSIIKYFIQNLV